MKHVFKKASLGFGAAAVAATGLATPSVQAQADELAINSGSVAFTATLDVYSQYWFRGLAQENQGLTIQPGATATFALFETDGFALDGFVGTWNSASFKTPTTDADSDDWWREANIFIGVGTQLLDGKLDLQASLVNKSSPAAGEQITNEIDIKASYDDRGLYGDDRFALNPYALLAYELDGAGVDAGTRDGLYLELGVEPRFELVESADFPVTLSVPVKAGFSLKDYYERADGKSNTFGYLQIGLVASTPIKSLPAEYGNLEGWAGVYYIYINDTLRDIGGASNVINSGDRSHVFAGAGLSWSY